MSYHDIRDSSAVNKGAELIRERASGEVTVYLFVSSLSFVAVNSDQAVPHYPASSFLLRFSLQ